MKEAMVARAKRRKWVNLVAGLLVGTAAQPLTLLAGPDMGGASLPLRADREERVVAQLVGGASRAHLALNGAIDAQRQGDLDKASALFREAQARQNDLTPDERRELERLLAANALAVQARRDAREQLALAEATLQQGRAAEAAGLVRKITANELYLSAADKQRFQALCQKLHMTPAGPAAMPAGNPAAQAHAKLQQARAELARSNLDAAEALAHEAERMRVEFGPREDSPRRVLEDLDKARKDPKLLLQASRAASQAGDLDRAEQLAHAAEQAGGSFTFALWGDTPAKALKEIQTARKEGKGTVRQGEKAAEMPGVPVAGLQGPRGGNGDKARGLIKQGRQALASGDLAQARKCAEQAVALKADLHWTEDNPAKLLDDVARADASRKDTPAAPTTGAAPLRSKEDALALLQQGREQLKRGELDEAAKAAARLRAASNIHWGLFFEDTPDRFQADVDHARAERNKEKSTELLTEARRCFEKKDYDGAEKLAYEAQKLHGSYSIWDLGDRPSKLLADVQAQRLRDHRIKLPEPPTVAKNDPDTTSHGPLAKNTPSGMNPSTQPGMPAGMERRPEPFNAMPPQAVAEARRLLGEARAALNMGDAAKARALADRVRDMHVALNNPDDDTPEKLYRDLARLTPPAHPPTMPGAPARSGGDALANATRARQLMAEAHTLAQQNRLVEARDRISQAQRLSVTFRPDEETPDQLYPQIAFRARQRIESLVHHAGETIRYGTQAPAARCQEAEKDLAQARQLAAAFGQDMQPIERTEIAVRQLRSSGGVTLVGGPAAPGTMLPPGSIEKGGSSTAEQSSTKLARGMELLEKARMELRSGETATARRLAEEAINSGAREQGLAVLRSIDTEEFNQRGLRANRAFKAVDAAYNRGDYRQASLLLAAIDTKLLDEGHKARLREIVSKPEMQAGTRGMPVALAGGHEAQEPGDKAHEAPLNPRFNPQPVTPTKATGDAGRARATDSADQSLLARTRAMREVKFQQLREQNMKVQAEALERFRTGQTDAAVDMLQDYLAELSQEQLDPGQLTLLRRPIESRVQQFRLMKAQVDFANQSTASVRESKASRAKLANAEQVKQKNVAELMKQYNDLFKLGKYTEAEALAMRAKELDPDNPMATAAVNIARTQRRKDEYQSIKDGKEQMFLDTMNDAEKEGDSHAVKEGITFEKDRERLARIQGRKPQDALLHMPRKTTEEKNIERKLSSPVNLNFTNAPLRQVIDDLRAFQAVNIYVDEPALAEKGISQDMPVTIKLEQIALKSALNLLLHSVHLTYVVKDGVLQITTEDHARGKQEQRVFQVTDLVIAVENFGQVGVTPASQLGIENVNHPMTGAPSPVTGPYTLNGGQPVGTPTGGSMAGGGSGFASDPSGQPQITKQRSQTNEDMLIKLITSTIEPRSWAEQGGPGTIEFFPLTTSLVINQTPDIQDQVADLLAALRRLQDQEVAVEVKFISIAEDFFERIGVNFNLNIVNRSGNRIATEPQLTSGNFQQPGFINQFVPNNFLSGLTPAGTLTSDLNIPITQTTYQQAIPPFGGYPGVPGFGGLTLGLAFLSDIQVFLFMEAVQGDIRSNVMQAPKLTLFNGQTANILVQDFQFFVVGVQVIPQLGQFTYFPQTSLFPLGVQLTIQAVISADRRFVRLSLTPSLSNLVNGEVNLFPVVTPIFPLFDGTATGQPVVFTQFVQQPRLTRVTVQTTVAVPDGGTVLMGGLKRLSEGRNEYGPPVLSKIPYLNRLFRNQSYGRSAESLLIMVTPRIIIQAEEEERQTGYVPPPAVVP
jgi:type II secretory pathway component GspD/PulD (secretin)